MSEQANEPTPEVQESDVSINNEHVESVDTSPEPVEETPDVSHETIAAADVEAAARAQGWDPTKGDKSALDFLADGRIYRDRMFDQIKELREENQKAYSIIAEKMTQQEKRTYEQEVAEAEANFREAVESGDLDRVNQIRQEYPQPPQELGAAPVADPNLAYVDQWREENPWFDSDPQLKKAALGFYQSEKLAAGVDDPRSILPAVKEQLQSLFPQKFNQGQVNPNTGRGAGAETSSKRGSAPKSGLTKSDLTPVEAADFDKFVSAGIKPEKLLKSIAKQRERENER